LDFFFLSRSSFGAFIVAGINREVWGFHVVNDQMVATGPDGW
jgi:hypothetical protein